MTIRSRKYGVNESCSFQTLQFPRIMLQPHYNRLDAFPSKHLTKVLQTTDYCTVLRPSAEMAFLLRKFIT